MKLDARIGAILDELKNTLATPDNASAVALVQALMEANRVFVAGAGRSGLMVRGFAMRLMHLGLDAAVVGETTTPAICDTDILLIGSGSGATASLCAHANKAHDIGARIALITIQAECPIGRLADITLTIPAPTPKIETDIGFQSIQPLGSLFEQCLLITLDALITLIMENMEGDGEAMFGRHANLE